ncbi:putative lipase [Lasiodiplodia hormozganensis]|uniref:Lipase n=1 Tax=Lasiodiplodia hormozganensis TaxID=869390 RepID=A0AA39Z3Q3_9PEZI|nr:putative lipase [Lasiodiplodia hormozganensis]
MLLQPRTYQLAQVPDRNTSRPASPFLQWTTSRKDRLLHERTARSMLLVHQAGSVKVGEIVRYTLTYTPVNDRILPSPTHLHLKIKNSSAIPLRAAYLHGPYTLHVAAYPSTFNPNHKVENPKKEGIPDFEPNLKAGGSWGTRLLVPDHIRESGSVQRGADGEPRSVTWIIEITSQILFSNSASVSFELLVGRDERSLDYGFAAVAGQGQGGPGQVEDHQQGKRHEGRHPAQPKGVYSRAIRLVVDDTTSLWDKPALPEWECDSGKSRTSRDGSDVHPKDATKVKRRQNIHVVIVTHGLHSNLGADMLYLKESIDAAAKQAREEARKRRRATRNGDSSKASPTPGTQADGGDLQDSSTAPLSGGQEDLPEESAEDDDPDEEQVVVRGFAGNAVRTERGIQYLGKRLAKYILGLTYPDQPYLPVKKSMKHKMSSTFSASKAPADEGIPAHSGSTVQHQHHHPKHDDRAYKFTSISFVGHSLGGLVQTYAIAYIHKHSPEFFHNIKPVNFICMASPLLGLSNENPMYVKFALDFGLVGRTGQDLGLTWRAPTIARGSWAAMVSGFGTAQKETKPEDPGAKPLLRILPTGPAHQVLRMFRNRTVYSNVVNDGIVPLRTSCLLFLDWKGLGRVEKARRENGLVGTLASWGFAELTGQNSSPNPSRLAFDRDEDDSGTSTPIGGNNDATVPQPAEDAVNQDQTATTTGEPQANQFLSEQQMQAVQEATSPSSPRKASAPSTSTAKTPGASNPFSGFISYLKGATTTPKDKKMFKRSQTVQQIPESSPTLDTAESSQPSHGRPLASRGDSTINNELAPPKTTIFESAGDILNPPIPPIDWIIDPSTRSRTIFHDRIYHPEDIPAPPVKRPKGLARSFSSDHSITSVSTTDSTESSSGMRVEEKIARSYHKDLSWRKVLVRLEPDAHNNIVVRRMFANAYGWPVIKHLCDTHFADTYAARTRDEREPAIDRAQRTTAVITSDGEEVEGQRAKGPPPVSPSEMREASDELAPLRDDSIASEGAGSSSQHHHDHLHSSHTGGKTLRREDSSLWDDTYFEGTEDESDVDDDEAQDNRGYFQRFLSPAPQGKNRKKPAPTSAPDPARRNSEDRSQAGTSSADIASFLTAKAPTSEVVVEGHRGLSPVITPKERPVSSGSVDKGKTTAASPSTHSAPHPEDVPLPSPSGTTIAPGVVAEVGLRKSIEEQMGSPTAAVADRRGSDAAGTTSVTEEVAKALVVAGSSEQPQQQS